TGFRSKGECDSIRSAAKRQGYAVGSNRLSATWSSGEWDRTPPEPRQLGNGKWSVGPPHRQLALRETYLHEQDVSQAHRLVPIRPWLRGEDGGLWRENSSFVNLPLQLLLFDERDNASPIPKRLPQRLIGSSLLEASAGFFKQATQRIRKIVDRV